jgi:hypothetical protein
VTGAITGAIIPFAHGKRNACETAIHKISQHVDTNHDQKTT